MIKTIIWIIACLHAISTFGQAIKEDFPGQKNHEGIVPIESPKNIATGIENRQEIGDKVIFPEILNLQNNETYVLDSSISEVYDTITLSWHPTLKTIYNYDAGGKRFSLFIYLRNSITDKWDFFRKFEFYNDDHGNDTLIVSFVRNNTTGLWIPSYKYAYTFDINGNNTSEIFFTWNETTSQWIPYTMNDYIFSYNGTQNLSFTANQKIGKSEREVIGNINGNIIAAFYYNWDDNYNLWLNFLKSEYTYNENGPLKMEVDFEWDGIYSQWINANKYEIAYDVNGNRIEEIYYAWHSDTNQWIGSNRYEYAYDENDNKTLELRYDWDTDTNLWILTSKYESTYNTNNAKNSSTNYIWNSNDNLWIPNFKDEYIYDSNGNETVITNSEWKKSDSQWVLSYRVLNSYSNHPVTSIDNLSGNEVTVYPNPAREFIVFDLQIVSASVTVEFFNMQGRKVLVQNLSVNKQISVRNLSKGIYLYRVIYDGKIQNGKIIIE